MAPHFLVLGAPGEWNLAIIGNSNNNHLHFAEKVDMVKEKDMSPPKTGDSDKDEPQNEKPKAGGPPPPQDGPVTSSKTNKPENK